MLNTLPVEFRSRGISGRVRRRIWGSREPGGGEKVIDKEMEKWYTFNWLISL
jgi:hypothetical protein